LGKRERKVYLSCCCWESKKRSGWWEGREG